MKRLPNVALAARSGAGKSLAADYFATRYGYVVCTPGAVCRQVTQRLFGTDSKTMLNKVNDAIRAIDPDVWLRVALEELPSQPPGTPVCVDGLRFKSNVTYCRGHGYILIKIVANETTRMRRLRARRQEYDAVADSAHRAETEIDEISFDHILTNEDDDPGSLYRQIDHLIGVIDG